MTLQPAVNVQDHSVGPADAPVVLVQYGDFQCPYTRKAHPIINALRAHFGLRMRFVFRNFPLTEIHPEALHAAEAAESVAAHAGPKAYWAMHDSLFAHQRDSEWALDDAHLVRYAEAAGADPNNVAKDLGAGVYEERVRTDLASGVASGVSGTPTFFINGEYFEGDWTDLPAFGTALEEAAAHAEPETEDALEIELAREAAEGADLIGDTKLNRNVSGSSTWETLPEAQSGSS